MDRIADLTPQDDRPDAPEGGLPPPPAPSPPWDEEPLAAPVVLSEPEVRAALENVGSAANWLLPTPEVFPDLWRFTDDELAELTPPLTRTINRQREAIRRVVQQSDALAVGVGFGRYVTRNIRAAQAAAQAAAEAEEAQAEAARTAEPGDEMRRHFGLEGP